MHYNEVGVRTADSMQAHHAQIIILGTVIYDDRNYSQRKPYQCVSSCRETQSSVTTERQSDGTTIVSRILQEASVVFPGRGIIELPRNCRGLFRWTPGLF